MQFERVGPGLPRQPQAVLAPGTAFGGAEPGRSASLKASQVVPFSNMRRRTAEHMVRSKATSPARLHRL